MRRSCSDTRVQAQNRLFCAYWCLVMFHSLFPICLQYDNKKIVLHRRTRHIVFHWVTTRRKRGTQISPCRNVQIKCITTHSRGCVRAGPERCCRWPERVWDKNFFTAGWEVAGTCSGLVVDSWSAGAASYRWSDNVSTLHYWLKLLNQYHR